MGQLAAFDVVVLLMIALAALAGAVRGFVTEVLTLGGWIAAVLCVRVFHEPATRLASAVVGGEAGGAVLAYVALFLGPLIVFRLVGGAIGSRTRRSVVGPIDRALGFGFGAAKGLIAASALFLLIQFAADVTRGIGAARPDWLRDARTAPMLATTSAAMVDWVEHARAAGERQAVAEGYEPDSRAALDKLVERTDRPPS